MRSMRFRPLAALMVAFLLALSSCVHGASSSTTGVQSAAPPKAMLAESGTASSSASTISGTLTFTTPDKWSLVPQEALLDDHDFAVVPGEGAGSIFGKIDVDVGVKIPEYFAQMVLRGTEQGFTSREPVFAEDVSWGMITMLNDDKVLIFGMRTFPTTPAITVFTFGRTYLVSLSEFEAASRSILTTLAVSAGK